MQDLLLGWKTLPVPAFGLVKRREIWVPTFKGWLLLLAGLALVAVGAVFASIPFLGPTQPVGSGILVVEGWLPDYALEQAKKTFETHPYRLLVVPGIPLDIGFYLSKEKNYAQLATKTLAEMGLATNRMVALPCSDVPRNRTYSTALRVRGWLEQEKSDEPVDVFTLGVHARRTWLLYRMALGNGHQVGIIAGADRRYTARRWWTTSNGVRIVTSEWIAYVYAKLLFYPGNRENVEVETDAK